MADRPDRLIHLPPEHESGAYANAFSIWHTAHEFTVDFAATQYPERADPEDPESPLIEVARVVARIRIPPTLAFDLIQAINSAMTRYEAKWGEIVHPEDRGKGEE